MAMKRRGVVVIGAGGHARVCIDVLRENGWYVRGCLSSDGLAAADVGVPMLGRTDDIDRFLADDDAVFVAIGDNRARLHLVEQLWLKRAELPRAVSPHAVVAPSAHVGAGTLIMPGAIVNAGTMIGDGVIINTRASVDHDCVVGDGAHVAPGVAIAGGVRVGNGAFIGIGSSVVPSRTIGDWAKVGAGSVVLRDVAANVTVVGSPARLLQPGEHAVVPAFEPLAPPIPTTRKQQIPAPGIEPSSPAAFWAPPATSAPVVAVSPGVALAPVDGISTSATPTVGHLQPSVLVVCTGNICRSPLTSALLRRHLPDAIVTSAGTHAQAGALADATTAKVAKELGIDLTRHHATPLKSLDLDEFDLIIGLGNEHRERIIRHDPSAANRTTVLRAAAWRARAVAALDIGGRQWVERLCASLDDPNGYGVDIEDPIGRTTRHQRRIAREIQTAVESLAGYWRLT